MYKQDWISFFQWSQKMSFIAAESQELGHYWADFAETRWLPLKSFRIEEGLLQLDAVKLYQIPPRNDLEHTPLPAQFELLSRNIWFQWFNFKYEFFSTTYTTGFWFLEEITSFVCFEHKEQYFFPQELQEKSLLRRKLTLIPSWVPSKTDFWKWIPP
jgi:hypothetical protein